MASSTVPTLELDGRNWKVFQIQKLRTSHEMFNYLVTKFQDPTPISIPTKKPIEALSDNETQELCMKPNKLSVEPPSEERLKDKLTEARSEVPSNLCMAWNELYEQPNSRAGGPLKSKHIKVLNGMVEVPDEVENVDKMAHEDLPSKPCDRSTTNDLPTVNLHGIKDELTSGTMNSQSGYTEEPRPTVYDPGSTLEQPTAHNQEAENEGRLSSPARHEDEASSCTKQHVPNACRVLLEGENTRCMSSNKRNLQEHVNTSRVLGMCTHSPSRMSAQDRQTLSESTISWRRVSIGDVNVPTPRNMPIDVPSFKNQDITFGRLASPNEGHMASGVKGDITGGHG
ncbi:hypothetical protein EDD16DRAFT_1526102 [Pisolithus croceorrhizus]|nr:hypothetical protein EDD16DRAFT_1526102 [Pisolithus croceorrhizus]